MAASLHYARCLACRSAALALVSPEFFLSQNSGEKASVLPLFRRSEKTEVGIPTLDAFRPGVGKLLPQRDEIGIHFGCGAGFRVAWRQSHAAKSASLPVVRAKIFPLAGKVLASRRSVNGGSRDIHKIFPSVALHQGGGAGTICFAYRSTTIVPTSTIFLLCRKKMVDGRGFEPLKHVCSRFTVCPL